MTKLSLAQQDEIIKKLSQAEAALDCLSIALDPSSIIKPDDKSVNNSVWLIADLVSEANNIAKNKGASHG